MQYNVQYIDDGGELNNAIVESHDVRAAMRETFYQYPQATRIFRCVLREVDNLGSSTEQTPG